MSSSPPPLVPSLASCDARSSSSPPSSHGSLAARVSHRLPSGGQFQDLRTGESTSDRVSVASAAQGPPAPGASLNPFAREFVPGSAVSPTNEGFIARAESAEGVAFDPSTLSSSLLPEVGNERVNGALLEGNQKEGLGPSKRNGLQRPGGLSTALKRGHAGQSRTLAVSRGGQGGADGVSSQTVTGSAGLGKRGQFTNANHLLNFQYDPIVRPPSAPRIPFTRKPHKVQPFIKELFLQANFRFLVSDFGDYSLNSSDPDKMLQWEDIAAVNVSAPVPVQCPICLETPPVCPQITSCGHIFCFPCILRYLALGEEEQRSDYFKKCPLCFAMTSSRALRTVFVDDVHNYKTGDYLELTLLNRAKGSIIPFEKSEPVVGALPYSKDGQCHSFSKFTLTSDADQTTNKAIAELSSWAEKAQNEADEDMDLLPFVFSAIDQLQQRKSAWNEHRVSEFLSSSPPVRQKIMAQTKEVPTNFSSQGLRLSATDNETTEGTKSVPQGKQRGEKVDIAAETKAAMADLKGKAGWVYENAFSDDEEEGGFSKTMPIRLKSGVTEASQPVKSKDIPSSWEENLLEKAHGLEKAEGAPDLDKDLQQDIKKDTEDTESYAFYQCADGQPLILHPLNMKCLLQHYGSYEKLPSRLQVRILEMEGQIQTEATRKRYRYLSHLPLTTNFWLCEVDLRGILPSSAFSLFIDELRYRETRRRRRLKQEHAERSRGERISAAENRYSPPAEIMPSVDDSLGEELPSGSASEVTDSSFGTLLPSPGPVEQRKLFSQVTRLGYASAHDAPDLTPSMNAEPAALPNERASSSAGTSASKSSPMSFADIIQAQPLKSAPNGTNGSSGGSHSSSKKNKKASKVLLSTAGGRRY